MNLRVFPGARPWRARAFTLVEMVITMTIFVLLAGAVFGIITGVLQSADILQDNQNRRDELMALQEYLKTQLDAMPGKATLHSYQRGNGEGLHANGIIFGTAGLQTAIDAKVQPNGLYTLRVATFSTSGDDLHAANVFEQAVTGDDDSLNWRDLIRDIGHVDWKFMAQDATQWTESWPLANTSKPNLVEFSIQQAGEMQPTVTDLWIPRLCDTQMLLVTASTNAP